MKAKANTTHAVKLQLSSRLYQRVKKAAQASQCGVPELVVSTLESRLPPLPKHLPQSLDSDLARWSLLDEPALRAIANAFLSSKQQRRFSTLLRRSETGQLNGRESAEWERLQQEYLLVSRNKAKAQFLLAQREHTKEQNGTAR